MGYSESSLRRLVDKIHDGTVNDTNIPNSLAGSHTRYNLYGAEHQNIAEVDVDNEFDDPMCTLDDINSIPPGTTSPGIPQTTIQPVPTMNQVNLESRCSDVPQAMYENEVNVDPNKLTLPEICAYQLITLLDEAKAPRNCYDRLIALLKRQQKMGFSVADAIGRDTFLKSLKKKFKCPSVDSIIIGDSTVFKFPFVHMLQNLLDVIGPDLHFINPDSIRINGSPDELWNTRWMINTFRYVHRDFSMEQDIMLPIIIYIDKTGTDAYQRFSLEPVIFSLGNISREKRESRRSWRHLGFIPSNNQMEKSQSKLQFYHNCLGAILQELKTAQSQHPIVRIKKHDGGVYELRARLPIVVVMGDQLSQDTLCARLKVNAGGASRIHRSCMCSYLSVDDPSLTCISVSQYTLNQMTNLALLSDTQISNISDGSTTEINFLRKVRQMNQRFLAKPYGTYPVVNAFEGADFGGWTEGIYEATLDDFMHSTELGVIKTLNEVIFQGLTKSECTDIEYLMQNFLGGVRSSVRSTYPRWRLADGFSRQKLMTSTERVGSLFSLCLALQSQEVSTLVSAAHLRQRHKYYSFSIAGTPSVRNHDKDSDTSPIQNDDTSVEFDNDSVVSEDNFTTTTEDDSHQENSGDNMETAEKFFFESHFQRKITPEQIRHALVHAIRHGFDIRQLESFDILQTNQFVAQAHLLFRKQKHAYPNRSIPGYFEFTAEVNIPDHILQLAVNSIETLPEHILPPSRFYGIESVTPKHFKQKGRIKGSGPTAAILNQDMHAVTLFLEYILCFHAFCKYSSSLPPVLRDMFENVHNGGRSIVRYIERQFYRGDDTVDYRTTKLHCHRRIGRNYEEMRSLMNFCTELGERLLKTEAKQISRTAQQRCETTFQSQTSERVLERQLLETFGDVVEDVVKKRPTFIREKKDEFSRNLPHFVFSRDHPTVLAMDRHGKTSLPDDRTGYIPSIIKKSLLQHETSMSVFEIYNEVILRDDSYIRAFPMYRNESPFYDFVQVQWEQDSSYPAKVVCFYKRKNDGEDSFSLYALVHVVDEKSMGKVRGFTNTFLSTHYNMKYERGQPTLYSVPVASIDFAVLAFPHESQSALFNPNKRGVCIVRPRNEWAYLWLAWNDVLKEENSLDAHHSRRRRDDRRYISFNTRHVLKKVKDRLQTYLTFEHGE
jgi:hypothetical protein